MNHHPRSLPAVLFAVLTLILSWYISRHERIHTRRPYQVQDAEKYCLEDDLVNLEVLDEVLDIW